MEHIIEVQKIRYKSNTKKGWSTVLEYRFYEDDALLFTSRSDDTITPNIAIFKKVCALEFGCQNPKVIYAKKEVSFNTYPSKNY